MRYPVKCRRPEITKDSLDLTFSKGFCSSAFSGAAAELFGEDEIVGITTVAFAAKPRSLRLLDGLLNNRGYNVICYIQCKHINLKRKS